MKDLIPVSRYGTGHRPGDIRPNTHATAYHPLQVIDSTAADTPPPPNSPASHADHNSVRRFHRCCTAAYAVAIIAAMITAGSISAIIVHGLHPGTRIGIFVYALAITTAFITATGATFGSARTTSRPEQDR